MKFKVIKVVPFNVMLPEYEIQRNQNRSPQSSTLTMKFKEIEIRLTAY